MLQDARMSRQWRLIVSLECPSGRTAPELAQDLGCSERTIWRDLQDLKSAGFPLLTQKEGSRTLLRFAEDFPSRLPLPIPCSELIALYLAGHGGQSLQGTPLQASLESLLAKIQAGLSAPMLQFLHEFRASTLPASRPSPEDPSQGRLMEQISQAIMDRQTLEINYYSASRDKMHSRKIDPYRLWYQEGKLHLIAYCHLRRRTLAFSFHRIRGARPTSQIFVLPEGLRTDASPGEHIGQMRGEPVQVEILFSPQEAPRIADRLFHPSQKMQYQLDGSLLVSLEVADTLELKRWILGFGQEAEVLEPKELRQAIRQEADALLERYSGRPRRPKLPAAKGKPGPPKERLRIEIL